MLNWSLSSTLGLYRGKGGLTGRKDIYHQIVIEALQKDGYGLIMSGWDGNQRVQGVVIHLDIIGDKIWLQHDGTDLNVALDLVEAGIPHEGIVLGFHPQRCARIQALPSADLKGEQQPP